MFSVVSVYHYRPQTKLRKGNVFTHVCHSVHRGGCLPGVGVYPSMHWADTPRQTPSMADTPPPGPVYNEFGYNEVLCVILLVVSETQYVSDFDGNFVTCKYSTTCSCF